MALPFAFTSVTVAHGSDLDNNFAAVGALGIVPGTVTGTNSIVFTAGANTPTISAYANYLRFAFVAAATNTTATTFRYGALGILNVYKDVGAGPTALSGGEIVSGNLITVAYDSALNSGAGGFHLLSQIPSSLALDAIGSTQGDILYRGSSSWSALTAGTSLQVLITQGSGANPAWSGISAVMMGVSSATNYLFRMTTGGLSAAPISTVFAGVSTAAGVLFYNDSGGALAALSPGSAGAVLTVSTGGLPSWV